MYIINRYLPATDDYEKAESRIIGIYYFKLDTASMPETYHIFKRERHVATLSLMDGRLSLVSTDTAYVLWELDKVEDPFLGTGEFTDGAQRRKLLNRAEGKVTEYLLP